MKRIYYFARRIPVQASAEECLPISSGMTADDIHKSYVEKVADHGSYLSNGPWILRPFAQEGMHEPNRFPPDITPHKIWRMVQENIAASSAVIALVDQQAYGTIAELSYAAGLHTVAVYVLPAMHIAYADYTDLWLSFQVSLETSALWQEDDITNVGIFAERGIYSLADYRRFVELIVPKFLSRES